MRPAPVAGCDPLVLNRDTCRRAAQAVFDLVFVLAATAARQACSVRSVIGCSTSTAQAATRFQNGQILLACALVVHGAVGPVGPSQLRSASVSRAAAASRMRLLSLAKLRDVRAYEHLMMVVAVRTGTAPF